MSLDEVRITYIHIAFALEIKKTFHFLFLFLFFSQKRFNGSAERVKTLTKRPTDMELLELYALFKQASFGDNNTGMFHERNKKIF